MNEEDDATESEITSSQIEKSRDTVNKGEEKDGPLPTFSLRRKNKPERPDREEDILEDPLTLFNKVMKENTIDHQTKLDLFICTNTFCFVLIKCT